MEGDKLEKYYDTESENDIFKLPKEVIEGVARDLLIGQGTG